MKSQLKKAPTPLCDESVESRVIRRSLQKLLTLAPVFELLDSRSNGRAIAEEFIAARFLRHHQALISEFLPTLVTLRCHDHHCAALGLRPAAGDNLFLEHYLQHALGIQAEQTIASLTQAPVSRNSIIEIGNLVSGRSGASALLFLIVLAVVHRAGFQWVMFTGTPEVQRGIQKLGFAIQPVCPGSPYALPGDHSQWGNYYHHEPQVVVGFVAQSMATCRDSPLMGAILDLFDNDIAAMATGLKAGASSRDGAA